MEISLQEAKVEKLRITERKKRQTTTTTDVNSDVNYVNGADVDEDINLDDVTALVK